MTFFFSILLNKVIAYLNQMDEQMHIGLSNTHEFMSLYRAIISKNIKNAPRTHQMSSSCI